MADEHTEPQAESKPARKKLPMTLIAVLGVAVLEAAGFLIAFQFMGGGGPQPTYGGEEGEHYAHGEEPAPEAGPGAEVELLKKFRVPNNKSGRMYIYDLDISLVVPDSKRELATTRIAERAAQISDCVARIVRGADQRTLNEDDLQSLRVQLKHELTTVLQDEGLVDRVLIPRCVPIRAD